MQMKTFAMLLGIFSFLLITTSVHAEIIYSDEGDSSSMELAADNPENSYTDSESSARFSMADENYDLTDRTYATNESYDKKRHKGSRRHQSESYSRLPSQISAPGEKVIIVDPNVHAWGAYSADGKLLRSGLATAGSKWCKDLKRPCRTSAGTFRIKSLGSSSCYSSKYPLGVGGAPMPYCMFFNGHQGLHGSNQVVAGNVSHGCVRMRVSDAAWVRFHFATIGTKVIVRPY